MRILITLFVSVLPFLGITKEPAISPLGIASVGTVAIGTSMIVYGAVSRNPKRSPSETFEQYVVRVENRNATAKRMIGGGIGVAFVGGCFGIAAYLTKDKRSQVSIQPDGSVSYTFRF